MRTFAIFLVYIAATLTGCSAADDGSESFGSKSDWSALQGLEYDSRGKALGPVRKNVGDSQVLGVPSNDGKNTIWILLNPQAFPFYKQMPQGSYAISQAELDAILQEKSASASVVQVLTSHVTE